MHTVADVFCVGCKERVGWYYYKASDHSQKYKEGKHATLSDIDVVDAVQASTYLSERG